MAKLWLGFPIHTITGRAGNGMYRHGSTTVTGEKPHAPTRARTRRPASCDCESWYQADNLYSVGKVPSNTWRSALKANGLSGYDLWMKEAESLARAGHYFPDVPSASGGYTVDRVVPGHTYQPPHECIKDYLKIALIEVWYPDPPNDHLRWDIEAEDPRKSPLGIATIYFAHYADGWNAPPRYSYTEAGETMLGDRYVLRPWLPLYYVKIEAVDGTWVEWRMQNDAAHGSKETGSRAVTGWLHLGDWE